MASKSTSAGGTRELSEVVRIDEAKTRDHLGAVGAREDEESWTAFLRHLKERGLKGVSLFTSDKCVGLVNALGVAYPGAMWQRCVVHAPDRGGNG
jgi:transposase-like protein